MRDRLTLADLRECFYVPGRPGIIDAVHPNTGRGVYGNRSLAEIREEYPGAEVGDFDEVANASDGFYRRGPEQCSRDHFLEMLEVLPPQQWVRRGDVQTWKMLERTSGRITNIYCGLGLHCYTLADDFNLPHAEIVRRCVEYAKTIGREYTII